MSRLGIIDWGIGGIGVLRLIKERLGDVPVTYFSDTGVTPYGKMPRRELVSRLDHVISFLKSEGVTHLVIGCNAASIAIDYLADHGIRIEGVIDRAVASTVKLKPQSLGLIGGRRTVLSGAYTRAFRHHGISVRQRIAQPLSALIESGDLTSDTLRSECRRILAPLKNSSHILLACTHYPAIVPLMQELVSSRTMFVDPAPALVDGVRGWRLTTGGHDVYLTTGNSQNMKTAAFRAFGWRIEKAKKINV